MPLISISAREANERVRGVRSSWPKRPEMQRLHLSPIAEPGFRPSFKIGPADQVFTMGSCFARNIENQMIAEGCQVAVTRFDVPPDRMDCKHSERLLNRFVPQTMLNELRWALDPSARFPEAALVELTPDHWIDPHAGGGIGPSSLERVQYRREAVRAYTALAGQSDVVVLTLGLAEAWFDAKTGHYMNLAPFRSAREAEPERYQFHVLDYNDILGCLEEMHALLARFGRPGFRMLVTVSPVPLTATFSGNDILVANTYSKAVQRSALEAFVLRHDNVDYFPSFESVTLSDRNRAWNADLSHASDEIVRINVLRMLEAYLEEPSNSGAKADTAKDAYALIERARAAKASGDQEAALAAYAEAARAAPGEPLVRLEYGRLLLSLKQPEAAAVEMTAAVKLGAGRYGGYYDLSHALAAAGRGAEAYTALARAREFEGAQPRVLLQSARMAERMGLYDDALGFLDQYIASADIDDTRRQNGVAIRRRVAEAARLAG